MNEEKLPKSKDMVEKNLTGKEKQNIYKLHEILGLITKVNIHSEIPTGKPIGKEIW